ncbi:MAG: thiamine pyrophosphate-dependent enzyme [Nannocystaceae bacterium]|nr:hypothetical protein [Myxococcales bacterium]
MEQSPWDPEGVTPRLDASGTIVLADGAPDPTATIDLRGFYRAMVHARCLDLALARAGLPMWAPAAGEEAVTASCASLCDPNEWIYAGVRDQPALAMLRGVSPASVLAGHRDGARYRGAPGGASLPGVNLGHVPETLGLYLGLAAGHAHALKLERAGQATVAIFGEGLTTVGLYRETVSLAVACDLPLVLLCKSQLWPEAAPAEAAVFGESVAERARAVGMGARRVDGADPVAVYEAIEWALSRARYGRGPTLVEAVITQLIHPDVPGHRDPIERLRRHLDRAGQWTPTMQDALEAELRGQLPRDEEEAP